MIMLTGINRIVEHDGRKLHLQAEDLGDQEAVYEVRVYDGGTVLWLKRFSYAEIVERNLSKTDHEQELRLQIDKTLQTVHAAILKGKIA